MGSLLFILLLATVAAVCTANPSNKRQSASSWYPSTGRTCGGISSLDRWARTGRSDTIQMRIDTSSCQFERTPMYFTSITGTAGHYLLVGLNAIYEPTPYGFLINVRSLDGQSADTLMGWSAQSQWNVNWVGFSS